MLFEYEKKTSFESTYGPEHDNRLKKISQE